MGTFPPCNALIEVAFRKQVALSQVMVVKKTRYFTCTERSLGKKESMLSWPKELYQDLLWKRTLSCTFPYHVILKTSLITLKKEYSC